MKLVIGKRLSTEVADFSEASRVYDALRDASGEGASTFPEGDLRGTAVYRVSYNAKIWEGDVCVFDPYAVKS